jgi:starch-binding outer membrane protein, SusD/RagB family
MRTMIKLYRKGKFIINNSSLINLLATALLILFIILIYGCQKIVEVNTPPTKTSTENAFKDNSTAAAVLTGIYGQLCNNYFNAMTLPATSLNEELAADNLALFDLTSQLGLTSIYQNALEPKYSTSSDLTYWRTTYTILYTINSSILSLRNNVYLKPMLNNRLLGEAYFLRAFCYFYLVNLYGDVPLILTPDYVENSSIARISSSEVYNQIVADLIQAETLLDNNYVASDGMTFTNERLRPNISAVQALLARVYLYQRNYAAAEVMATKVIDQSAHYDLAINLEEAFIKNSSETIWSLQSVSLGYNTREAALFILPDYGPEGYTYPVYISKSLLNNFEPGDNRKEKWIGNVTVDLEKFYYPAKYKIAYDATKSSVDEYTIVLRLSEQYLIRAETRNEQNNIAGAVSDLNVLRMYRRAAPTISVPNPLPDVSVSVSQDQLREMILNERRVELFTEWGHRWFDLRRSNTLDAVMTEAQNTKGGTWNHFKAFYPIPVSDILLNPSLTQNEGYQD